MLPPACTFVKKKYIIEINNKEGIATLNHPIYVGNAIPVIPDFFDLNQRTIFTGPVDLGELREDLLDLINETREDLGFQTIELSEELNTLAQKQQ